MFRAYALGPVAHGHRKHVQTVVLGQRAAISGDTTVVINGVMVQDKNDLPDDFPALVEKQLASTVPMLRNYGIDDAEDLFIVPVSGQSKWAIYSKKLGFANTGIYITPQSLRAERAGARGIDEEAHQRRGRGQGRIQEAVR